MEMARKVAAGVALGVALAAGAQGFSLPASRPTGSGFGPAASGSLTTRRPHGPHVPISTTGEATSTSLASSYSTSRSKALEPTRRAVGGGDAAAGFSSGTAFSTAAAVTAAAAPSTGVGQRRRQRRPEWHRLDKVNTLDVVTLARRLREGTAYLGGDEERELQHALALAVHAHTNSKGLRDGVRRVERAVEVCLILGELEMDTDALLAALLSGVLSPTAGPLGFGRAPTGVKEIEERFGARVARLVASEESVARLEAVAQGYMSASSAVAPGAVAAATAAAAAARVVRRGDDATQEQLDKLRNLILSEVADWRVVILRVAAHLQRMRSLAAVPSPRARAALAREALDVHGPLAHRLGMHGLRNELENLAFAVLYPRQHAAVATELAARRPAYAQLLSLVSSELAAALEADTKLMAEVESVQLAGRTKEPFSMWRKMLRQRVGAAGIYDAVALRVVLRARRVAGESDATHAARSEALCYRGMDVVRRQWRTMDERAKDYVASPKENGYQSLHTTALASLDGFDGAAAAAAGDELYPFEVQVRSFEMHQQAEYGMAAHWSYKGEGSAAHVVLGTAAPAVPLTSASASAAPGVPVAPAASIAAATTASVAGGLWPAAQDAAAAMARESIADGRDFVNWLHGELRQHKVFVFGPDGLIWDLHKSATAADILRRVSIGNFYLTSPRGAAAATPSQARVNGQCVHGDYQLSNGDVVSLCA